jgi:hypothetical protein
MGCAVQEDNIENEKFTTRKQEFEIASCAFLPGPSEKISLLHFDVCSFPD